MIINDFDKHKTYTKLKCEIEDEQYNENEKLTQTNQWQQELVKIDDQTHI